MHFLSAAVVVAVLTVVQDGKGEPAVESGYSIESLSGETIRGEIVEWGDSGVRLKDREKQIPYTEMLLVKPPEVDDVELPEVPLFVQLTDGSQLTVSSYEVKGRTASVELMGGRKLEIPTRSVQYVRFRKPDEPVAEQWKELTTKTLGGDVVVLRRAADSLDELEGVITDVTAETVSFELDGSKVPLKREKLEGIIYFHTAGRKLPRSLCLVETTAGEKWQVREIKKADDALKLVSRGGVEVSLPIRSIRSLDFSAGNLVYLSDIEWTEAKWTPHLGAGLPLEQKMFAPQKNRGLLFSGDKLFLRNKSYDKGLSLHSRTEITYRLTDDYKKLTAVAGIDDRAGDGGDLNLIIYGDDRVLFRKQIRRNDAPVPIDLDISGVRRLKILADFGENGSIADHLVLCQARITK